MAVPHKNILVRQIMKLNSDIIGGDSLGVYQGFPFIGSKYPSWLYMCWHLEAMLATSLNFCYVQLSTCSKCKKDNGIQEKIMITYNCGKKNCEVW